MAPIRKAYPLKGYAARPRWSHDGRQIAVLLYRRCGRRRSPHGRTRHHWYYRYRHPQPTDRRSRPRTGQLRQVSPPNLHVYDYDWSPDDKTFVATAAPGPGDNNWWIAQIYTIDIAKGDATSIYKPVAASSSSALVARREIVAFIEGLMSDEGFHGGDLFTISADGHDISNHTEDRKSLD